MKPIKRRSYIAGVAGLTLTDIAGTSQASESEPLESQSYSVVENRDVANHYLPDIPGNTYPSAINHHGTPEEPQPDYSNPDITPFADQGAWHAYALPTENESQLFGSFTGPLYIAQEYTWYLSKAFTKINICDKTDNNEISLSNPKKLELNSHPGLLRQELEFENISIIMELRFATDRTAFVCAKIRNTSEESRKIDVNWSGSLFKNEFDATHLKPTSNGVKVTFDRIREKWDYMTSGEEQFTVRHRQPVETTVESRSYKTHLKPTLVLTPGTEEELVWTESYTFTHEGLRCELNEIKDIQTNTSNYIENASERWCRYLNEIVYNSSPIYDKIGVKALETLITNWRSPAGAIQSNGMTPSLTDKWFAGGFWAWDSWKHAVGAARFDPWLAKQIVRSMFDYQITSESQKRPYDAGMIPDLIAYNSPEMGGGNWSVRNSKPPLAAWAIWKIFQRDHDIGFIQEMYPKLVAYHKWWYRTRDHNNNGIAEYGATVHSKNDSNEAIVTAAAWESGMDNAPRFDQSDVLKNYVNESIVGYSINQESVDLNSYLYREKRYLACMANILGKNCDEKRFRKEARSVRDYIQTYMYDSDTGFFYDVTMSKEPINHTREVGRSIDGAIPLWAEVATRRQAAEVRAKLTDEDEFSTYVPFPTVARSAPNFDPESYWRGRVWLDQAKFAIEGLNQYDYNEESVEMTKKLVHHAAGILGDSPINENYNPLNGEDLGAQNFSWSAASLLTLYQDYL